MIIGWPPDQESPDCNPVLEPPLLHKKTLLECTVPLHQ